eukprot:5017092-Pleurochrysis_carterae.AAC.1
MGRGRAGPDTRGRLGLLTDGANSDDADDADDADDSGVCWWCRRFCELEVAEATASAVALW